MRIGRCAPGKESDEIRAGLARASPETKKRLLNQAGGPRRAPEREEWITGVQGAARAHPEAAPGASTYIWIFALLSPGAPGSPQFINAEVRQHPLPSFITSSIRCLQHNPKRYPHILSPCAPRAAPTLVSPLAIYRCAPAQPPTPDSLFNVQVRPGAINLDFSLLLSAGAPQRSPPDLSNSVSVLRDCLHLNFSLFCPRVRPGAALHFVFPLLSAGAPRSSPTPYLTSSVSGSAPAQPYT
ncbi:hypothetical protein CDAR_536401 [Caerostris darwini]|uniref:Uncharacterized protein n=1 Tax=Caerostris darwini TaxID=1538125 RepID=A0AAV4S5N5_9ARAC|nr:hypothetical protein CDAR_536401 [Caerostris darwini]